MSEISDYWKSVVETLRDRGCRFRVKWVTDENMSDWQPWLICPVEGCLETGTLGPVPVAEVEWLDISNVNRDGNDHTEVIAKLLLDMGAHFIRNADTLRVTPQVSQQ